MSSILDLDAHKLSNSNKYYNAGFYQSISHTDMDMDMETDRKISQQPFLEITEHPVDKYRFRYKSEMHGTHGAINGINSSKTLRTYPSVRLNNYNGKATIRCTLYQCQDLAIDSTIATPHQSLQLLHPHSLVVRKDNDDVYDPHDVDVAPGQFEAIFRGMGIIHTAKKDIEDALLKKYVSKMEFEKPGSVSAYQHTLLKQQAANESKLMNLNQVRLGFEAFCKDEFGNINYISKPIISNPINNMKSVETGELKIIRLSLVTGSAAGGDDLFLFVEKVGKKNIKVRFYEDNEFDYWEDYGEFSEVDVHHQYAIALRTPPYKNPDIKRNANVWIQLERPSDKAVSASIPFQYKPKLNHYTSTDWDDDYSTNSYELPTVIKHEKMTISEEYNKSAEINKLLRETAIESEEFRNFMKYVDSNSEDLLKLMDPKLEVDGDTEDYKQKYQKIKSYIKEMTSTATRNSITAETNLKRFIEDIQSQGKNLFHILIAYGPENDQFMYDLIKTYQLETFVQCRNAQQENCLHIAVKYNKSGHILPLIPLVDITEVNIDGDTPLHIAIEKGRNECIAALLNKQIVKRTIESAIIANYKGMTPLHLAVQKNNQKAVESLLKNGAPANICETKSANNILHLAAGVGSKKLVETILKNTNQIRLTDTNKNNCTPLDVAKSNKAPNIDIITLLECEANTCLMPIALHNIKDEKEESNDSSSGYDSILDIRDIDMTPIMSKNTQHSIELIESQMGTPRCGIDKDYADVDHHVPITKIKEEIDVSDQFKTLFDDKCLQDLCTVFNNDDKWKILAEQLNCKSFITVWQKSKNPSMMLFRFLEVQEIKLDRFVDIFQLLEIKDALICIDEMLARREWFID